ncbi:MAG: peptidoglycan DD-metalloendopeptidase family protein [Spirochaetota bacterium]
MRGIIERQQIGRRDRSSHERRIERLPGGSVVGDDFGRRGAARRMSGAADVAGLPEGGAIARQSRAELRVSSSPGVLERQPLPGPGLRGRVRRTPRRRHYRWKPGLKSRTLREVGPRVSGPVPPSGIATIVALPIAVVTLAWILGAIGAFDHYARHMGFAVPSTDAMQLVSDAVRSNGRGGEPMSIDASAFEQIRRTEYTVQPGDTISEIAHNFGIDPATILSMNPVDDVRRLLPGTRLSIPDRDGLFYAVQPGDSLSRISSEYGVSVASILDANDLASPTLSVGDTLFIPGVTMDEDEYLLAIGELFQWPVGRFRFTSGYGMRDDPITGEWRMHSGIDLANAVGTPVLAARSGWVAHVEPNAGTFGQLVIIDHSNGFQTLYAHLSGFTVVPGQRVVTGQMIGRMGNTGRSTGSHLHFSVIRNRRFEDPVRHMPPR